MKMNTAGITICAVLAMVSTGWTQQTAPKKFHSGATPHHSTKGIGEGKSHSAPANVVSQKTQTARQGEVERLERQNAARIQAQSRQSANSAHRTQAPKTKPEPATRSSSINFTYHPPRTQTQGTSGGKKH